MCELLSNYSRRPPYYSGIFPDSFYHLLFQKLFQHNVRMPKSVIDEHKYNTTFQLALL